MITAAQVRGARAILRITVADLAKAADVSPNTIVRVEADKSVNTATLKALQAALEAQGVRFTADGCVCPPTAAA